MRLEIITAVLMKISVFWEITPCSLVYRYQPFGKVAPTLCGVDQWNFNTYIPPDLISQKTRIFMKVNIVVFGISLTRIGTFCRISGVSCSKSALNIYIVIPHQFPACRMRSKVLAMVKVLFSGFLIMTPSNLVSDAACFFLWITPK